MVVTTLTEANVAVAHAADGTCDVITPTTLQAASHLIWYIGQLPAAVCKPFSLPMARELRRSRRLERNGPEYGFLHPLASPGVRWRAADSDSDEADSVLSMASMQSMSQHAASLGPQHAGMLSRFRSLDLHASVETEESSSDEAEAGVVHDRTRRFDDANISALFAYLPSLPVGGQHGLSLA